MWRNLPVSPPYEEFILMEPETPAHPFAGYNQYIRGFFVPPKTGKYRFYMSGWGSYDMWISNQAAPGRNMVQIA